MAEPQADSVAVEAKVECPVWVLLELADLEPNCEVMEREVSPSPVKVGRCQAWGVQGVVRPSNPATARLPSKSLVWFICLILQRA